MSRVKTNRGKKVDKFTWSEFGQRKLLVRVKYRDVFYPKVDDCIDAGRLHGRRWYDCMDLGTFLRGVQEVESRREQRPRTALGASSRAIAEDLGTFMPAGALVG